VLAVLTKADKLPRGQRAERARAFARDLALPDDQVQPTSSHSGEGVAELAAAVLHLADTCGVKRPR
jgi:GTP-binding protein EngB required for normal cell division